MYSISKFFLLSLFLIPLFLFATESENELKKRMINDLDVIYQVLNTHYAPKEWKEQTYGWNLSSELFRAKEKVLALPHPAVKPFQKIILDFLSSTKDYHVNARFYSTETARLPFRVESAEDRYFVVYVNKDECPIPLEVGDELLSYDAMPIESAIKKWISSNDSNATDRALANGFFTRRTGKFLQETPQGNVYLTFRKKTGEIQTGMVSWAHEEEKITSPFETKALCFNKEPSDRLENGFFKREMKTPLYEGYKEVLKDGEEEFFLGARKSSLPFLGTPLWQTDESDPFHAYIFKDTHDRLIGYIRLPSFDGSSSLFLEFASLMNRFEEKTEALIIDEVNNPGGSVFYLYALLSTLSNQPLLVPPQREILTQERVYDALALLDDCKEIQNDTQAKDVIGSLDGYPVDLRFVQGLMDYCTFIIQEWREGKTFIDPTYVFGISFINPSSKGCYSKPLLVLINELDFSAADFFPAVLQDNHRAKLLGTKTAGAGGYVLGQSYPNLFGLAYFTYTGSIAMREGKLPIENLGVTPDISYVLTARDYQENYVDYKAFILKTLEAL